jgi:hypothetical protein
LAHTTPSLSAVDAPGPSFYDDRLHDLHNSYPPGTGQECSK